ncbi:MAG: AAA family ATPase [Candidatus Competibacteraceae bacterium]|nr:AAA family ATPase [Candidatus Competibacteraceae bacterium]MCB1821008.1 AAA family ATPase [Candidatus Competibacteraceae bacterium]
MKFPYGLSDFSKIIQSSYFYQDRTDRIPLLEATGDQLVFIRPRRFGKSLLLSMLEHYYDVNRADQFETLFGHLAIGQNPTLLHNRYFVMTWDFSLVKAQREVKDLEMALHRHINLTIKACAAEYGWRNIEIAPGCAPFITATNKVPFVAAVSLNAEGPPLYAKVIPVPGLTCAALSDWAKAALAPGSPVLSDGFGGFTGVTAAGCDHQAIIVGLRKPHQAPEFGWPHTILGNLKTRFSGVDHAFNFAKYGTRYLAAFAYRVNRRFHLDTLPAHLLVAAIAIGPRPTRWLRQAEKSC